MGGVLTGPNNELMVGISVPLSEEPTLGLAEATSRGSLLTLGDGTVCKVGKLEREFIGGADGLPDDLLGDIKGE